MRLGTLSYRRFSDWRDRDVVLHGVKRGGGGAWFRSLGLIDQRDGQDQRRLEQLGFADHKILIGLTK